MVHQKGFLVLSLKPLISPCSQCLRVIELPILGSFNNDISKGGNHGF